MYVCINTCNNLTINKLQMPFFQLGDCLENFKGEFCNGKRKTVMPNFDEN